MMAEKHTTPVCSGGGERNGYDQGKCLSSGPFVHTYLIGAIRVTRLPIDDSGPAADQHQDHGYATLKDSGAEPAKDRIEVEVVVALP
jgi:hypothetical protein